MRRNCHTGLTSWTGSEDVGHLFYMFPHQWKLEGYPSEPHFEKQYTPGETYVFRVSAQGTRGLSYWSSEAIRGAA